MSSSLVPWWGWGRGGDRDWLTNDVWDPFSSDYGWDRGRSRDRDDTTAMARANVDWRETDRAHIFRADLPGVRKEEVKVHVEDGNVLQISGERFKEEEDQNDRWHRVERRRGSFVRRFRLPDTANLDDIKCNLEHGVLTVTVPKREQDLARKEVRQIDIA